MVRIFLVALFAVLLTSCGSGTNNDQGVSFLNLGYFIVEDGEDLPACGTLPNALVAASTPLAGGFGEGTTGGTGQVGFVNSDGVALIPLVGVQNLNSAVGVSSAQVNYSYSVPGSSLAIPDTFLPVALVLGPGPTGLPTVGGGVGDGQETTGTAGAELRSSLPPGFNDLCYQGFVNFEPVPGDIREYLLFNKSQLPPTPFSLVVTTSVSGVTTAGDFFETNEQSIVIELSDDVGISGSGGSSSSELTEDEELF